MSAPKGLKNPIVNIRHRRQVQRVFILALAILSAFGVYGISAKHQEGADLASTPIQALQATRTIDQGSALDQSMFKVVQIDRALGQALQSEIPAGSRAAALVPGGALLRPTDLTTQSGLSNLVSADYVAISVANPEPVLPVQVGEKVLLIGVGIDSPGASITRATVIDVAEQSLVVSIPRSALPSVAAQVLSGSVMVALAPLG